MSKGSAQAQMESLKVQIDQLRAAATLQRKRVSEVAKDLVDYCEKHKQRDVLVIGLPDSQNPYQEKKGCSIL